MKKTKRTTLRNKADKLFSLAIRSVGKCANCGGTENLQCAHVISRSYWPTRWDEDNAVCLDARCHIYFTHRPLEWEDWVNDHLGKDKRLELKQRAQANLAVTIDYDLLIADLKDLLTQQRAQEGSNESEVTPKT